MNTHKMKKGHLVLRFLLTVMVPVLLSGCSSTAQPQQQTQENAEALKKLGAVTVISREEGSGTRDVFAGLAGFGQPESGKMDKTREDAVIKDSTEEVAAAVAADPSAIGYISMGALELSEGIKAVRVNDIELNRENVGKGSYPLTSSFYLAYIGNLNDLEQDFLTYVKGKGQEIAGKDYVATGKSGTFLSDKAPGTITIHGSTSVEPLMRELAAEYRNLNPNAEIEITASDSTKGLNDALGGACDFGMVSRELADYEKELLNYETIAREGIAVIVHENNPLENVVLRRLGKVYTGEIQNWEELNIQTNKNEEN